MFHVKHFALCFDTQYKNMLNEAQFKNKYIEIFNQNGLTDFCTDEIITKMRQMTDYMLEVHQHMNLTAITEPTEVIAKHLADCVLAAKYIPEGAAVCDIGCGGGFPSLPLAIARPDITILGVDSTEKRINYVNESAKRLELTNLKAICGRAEELGNTELRESFDICIARAVASLPVLAELCIPFTKVGGHFVAMKGRITDEEIEHSLSACKKLGAEAPNDSNINRLSLIFEGNSEERAIVCLKKQTTTPSKYPRNYSQIKKKPL